MLGKIGNGELSEEECNEPLHHIASSPLALRLFSALDKDGGSLLDSVAAT